MQGGLDLTQQTSSHHHSQGLQTGLSNGFHWGNAPTCKNQKYITFFSGVMDSEVHCCTVGPLGYIPKDGKLIGTMCSRPSEGKVASEHHPTLDLLQTWRPVTKWAGQHLAPLSLRAQPSWRPIITVMMKAERNPSGSKIQAIKLRMTHFVTITSKDKSSPAANSEASFSVSQIIPITSIQGLNVKLPKLLGNIEISIVGITLGKGILAFKRIEWASWKSWHASQLRLLSPPWGKQCYGW